MMASGRRGGTQRGAKAEISSKGDQRTRAVIVPALVSACCMRIPMHKRTDVAAVPNGLRDVQQLRRRGRDVEHGM